MCRHNQELRAAWGCEAPTAGAQLLIPCVDCGGEDPDCATCQGVGFEPVFRCPWSQELGPALEALWLVTRFPEVLPCAGGFFDQPAKFVDCVRVVGSAEAQLSEQAEGVANVGPQ